MARTKTDARLLRREMPGTMGLLAAAGDFDEMRRYRSFAFEEHAAYLRQVEALLRARAAQGAHTSVALFDPAGFARFCADRGLEPDSAASRCRYVAEDAGRGPVVPYAGQPMDRLVPQLLDEVIRSCSRQQAEVLLAAAGECEDCGEDLGVAALARAEAAVDGLTAALGPGVHHVVCTVRAAGLPMAATAHGETAAGEPPRLATDEAAALHRVLAAGIVADGAGAVVARTRAPDGPAERPPDGPAAVGGADDAASSGPSDGPVETVRGWRLRDGWLEPLSEAEVFAAYCTDAATGEPVPPEPGVAYRAGVALPRPPGKAHP